MSDNNNGGIFNGIGGAILGAAGTIYQNVQNRKEAEKAFQRQRQLINEANIYNAPINQMARLREAGLNPHLIYGQGPGSMVSANAGTPPSAHQENIAENIGIYATMKQIANQKRQLDLEERKVAIDEQKAPVEIQKILSDTENTATATKGLVTDNEIKKIDHHIRANTQESAILRDNFKTILDSIMLSKATFENLRSINLFSQLPHYMAELTPIMPDYLVNGMGKDFNTAQQDKIYHELIDLQKQLHDLSLKDAVLRNALNNRDYEIMFEQLDALKYLNKDKMRLLKLLLGGSGVIGAASSAIKIVK